MISKSLSILLLMCFSICGHGAELSTLYRIGAEVIVGRPVTRIGLMVGAQLSYPHISSHLELRWHYNIRSYGPPIPSTEWQARLALIGGWGRGRVYHFIPHLYLPHYSQNYLDLGYTLSYYHDDLGSSQWTGTVLGRVDKISIALENDILVPWGVSDSYRTGTLQLYYADSTQMIEWRNTMYTGYTQCPSRRRHWEDGAYPARWGYIDFSDCRFSSYSHGVSALVYHRLLPYDQIVSAGLGIDDERIRDFWQNRVIHDMYFFPQRWNQVRNLHIPMVAESGALYLYEPDQSIRHTRVYWQLGLNAGTGY